MMEPGSVLGAVAGGSLIGASAVLMLALNGRVLGVSGIAAGVLGRSVLAERLLAGVFLAGMLAGGLLIGAFLPHALPGAATPNRLLLALAGLAVGFGTRLGGGCTSGHGVCGISRLSTRSLIATVIFMVVAMATVYVARHVPGGGGA